MRPARRKCEKSTAGEDPRVVICFCSCSCSPFTTTTSLGLGRLIVHAVAHLVESNKAGLSPTKEHMVVLFGAKKSCTGGPRKKHHTLQLIHDCNCIQVCIVVQFIEV